MNESALKAKAFNVELGQLVKDLAVKHGLVLKKSNLSYDDFQYRSRLQFDVVGKQGELKALEAKLYSSDGDPKIGDVLSYRGTQYVVTGYNRKGNLNMNRKIDSRPFIFKRNRVTFKFDYFDKVVA